MAARTAKLSPVFRNSLLKEPSGISTLGPPIPKAGSRFIIVLDQFSRSVWRGNVSAFAQDKAALALAMEGLSNGHYAALPTPWFKVVHGLTLGHCEGPDHLERLDLLIGFAKRSR